MIKQAQSLEARAVEYRRKAAVFQAQFDAWQQVNVIAPRREAEQAAS
jgi:hypothetical protein